MQCHYYYLTKHASLFSQTLCTVITTITTITTITSYQNVINLTSARSSLAQICSSYVASSWSSLSLVLATLEAAEECRVSIVTSRWCSLTEADMFLEPARLIDELCASLAGVSSLDVICCSNSFNDESRWRNHTCLQRNALTRGKSSCTNYANNYQYQCIKIPPVRTTRGRVRPTILLYFSNAPYFLVNFP